MQVRLVTPNQTPPPPKTSLDQILHLPYENEQKPESNDSLTTYKEAMLRALGKEAREGEAWHRSTASANLFFAHSLVSGVFHSNNSLCNL
jgi:hypothetical protein